MGFSRQEYWSGLPFPAAGDSPDPEMKPTSPALAGRFFLSVSHKGNPSHTYILHVKGRKRVNNSNNALNIKVERVEVWKL